MRIREAAILSVACTTMFFYPTTHSRAQAPVKAAPATGNLGQLMKGIFYTNSNVIFFAQAQDPAQVKTTGGESSTATDPLQSAYGKWEAVENSALAIVDAASLLTPPGRKCANGRDVPVKNADWPKFVQGLREAGLVAYKAAQAKDQDKILDAADALTTACANCHDKYRETATLAQRCM
jgi:hypothetical protein